MEVHGTFSDPFFWKIVLAQKYLCEGDKWRNSIPYIHHYYDIANKRYKTTSAWKRQAIIGHPFLRQ